MASDRELEAVIATNRFGLGARPGEIQAARGDPRGWLKAQIRPRGADQPTGPGGAALPTMNQSFTTYARTSAAVKELFQGEGRAVAANTAGAGSMMDAGSMMGGGAQGARAKALTKARLELSAPMGTQFRNEMLGRTQLAVRTGQSFRERWTLFWANHFTVAYRGPPLAASVGPFEREAVRPHVFGRFEDLLVAASGHPAMLLYLDQQASVGPNSPGGQRQRRGLNENLAREILELHTLGADGGYTQADVTEFARALTGRTMGGTGAAPEEIGAYLYRANWHEPGPRRVLGRIYGQEGDGQAAAILADLARHPATARHVCRRIAAHFVADAPPPALVARLEAAWRGSGGQLATVAAALIDSPEAWTPTQAKFKTPNEYLVSAYRAVGAEPQNGQREVDMPLLGMGQRPFSAPQPNGWSDEAKEWASPDAIIKRIGWARTFGARYAPAGAPQDIARSALGAMLNPKTTTAMARAESRPEAMAMLLMCPEFQRR